MTAVQEDRCGGGGGLGGERGESWEKVGFAVGLVKERENEKELAARWDRENDREGIEN